MAVDDKTFAIFSFYIFLQYFLYIGCDPNRDYAIVHVQGPLRILILLLWAESLQGAWLGFKKEEYLAAGRRINNLTMPHPSQVNLFLGRQSL